MASDNLTPTADGAYTNFTAYGEANRWQCIDDTPGSPDDATTYLLQAGFPLPRQESVILSAFSPASSISINRVSIIARCQDGDAGDLAVRLFLRIDSVNYYGETFLVTPTGSYITLASVWETNPTSNRQWATADLAALEAGIEVVSGSLLYLTQLYGSVFYSQDTLGIDVVGTIEGSVQDGGWKASGEIFNNADELLFNRRLAVWLDSYYSGGWEASPRNAFQGHLLPDPWEKTIQGSRAGWTAFTAQQFLKDSDLQGIFFKHVASSPANRHQIIDMNYAKIVYELISGHCNAMHMIEAANYDSQLWAGAITSQTYYAGFMLLDLDIAGSSPVTVYEIKEGNFLQRIQEMANIDFFIVYFDKFNRLHFVPHPMFDATLPDPVITLTSAHLLAPLKFEKRNTEAVGQIKLHGFTPAGVQISGKYPANPTPGPVIVRSNYLATSSSQMTAIATRMYKYENRDYTVTAQLPNAAGLMLDLLDRVAITYTSAADGIAWTAKKFWVHRDKVDLLGDFNARTELVLEAEAA